MPEVIAFKRHAGCQHEVTFPQCSFGSIYRKMTTFLLTPALGHILGDLTTCDAPTPTMSNARVEKETHKVSGTHR